MPLATVAAAGVTPDGYHARVLQREREREGDVPVFCAEDEDVD